MGKVKLERDQVKFPTYEKKTINFKVPSRLINKIRLTVSNVYIVTFSIGELNLRSFQPRCVVHRSHNPVVIPITVGRRWAVLSPCDELMPDILDNHIKFLDSILRVRKIYSTFT